MISKKRSHRLSYHAVLTLGVVSLAQTRKPLMRSSVFDWSGIEVKQTNTGARRDIFDSPTATLDQLECHVTTSTRVRRRTRRINIQKKSYRNQGRHDRGNAKRSDKASRSRFDDF